MRTLACVYKVLFLYPHLHMNKLTVAAASGALAIAIVVPALAQTSDTKPSVVSQACVQALVARDTAELTEIDAMTAAHKSAIQAHKTALTAALALTDDTARKAAVKKANDDMKTAMKAAMEAQKSTHQATMDAVKTACGRGMGMGMRDEGMGKVMGRKGGHHRDRMEKGNHDQSDTNEQGEDQQ